jgi:acyl dehydratase
MKTFEHLSDLQPLVGQEIGVSDWIVIDQQRIDRFAAATGDHQWIHVDPQRAAAGPFGATVAHGFLTLSLVAVLGDSAFAVADSPMGLNYGLDRVRFPHPVRVGSRLRAHFVLSGWQAIEGGAQLRLQCTLEIDGAAKPACVAELLARRFT